MKKFEQVRLFVVLRSLSLWNSVSRVYAHCKVVTDVVVNGCSVQDLYRLKSHKGDVEEGKTPALQRAASVPNTTAAAVTSTEQLAQILTLQKEQSKQILDFEKLQMEQYNLLEQYRSRITDLETSTFKSKQGAAVFEQVRHRTSFLPSMPWLCCGSLWLII